MKILIVDDEAVICENLCLKIKRLAHLTHYETIISHSAHEAFILFKEQLIDVVLTDIHMPGMSGIALVEKIRKINTQVPIIVLSGHDDFNYVRQAFLAGVDDYLLKPVSVMELGEKLLQVQKKVKQYEQPVSDLTIEETEAIEDKGVMKYVKEYMLLHLHNSLSMREVAEQVNMSYSYFSKVFKQHMGQSFNAYLLKIRMEKALEYIEDPTIKVNEIAYKIGYANPSHFSRAFKQYTGSYPMEYREKMYR